MLIDCQICFYYKDIPAAHYRVDRVPLFLYDPGPFREWLLQEVPALAY